MRDFNCEVHLPATSKELAVLRLAGVLDSYSLPDLEKTLQDLMRDNRCRIVVNCERLRFISSAGMGLFLGTLGEVEKQGGSLSFAQVTQPEVHDAMSLLGFFEVFPVFDQETEAIKKNLRS